MLQRVGRGGGWVARKNKAEIEKIYKKRIVWACNTKKDIRVSFTHKFARPWPKGRIYCERIQPSGRAR